MLTCFLWISSGGLSLTARRLSGTQKHPVSTSCSVVWGGTAAVSSQVHGCQFPNMRGLHQHKMWCFGRECDKWSGFRDSDWTSMNRRLVHDWVKSEKTNVKWRCARRYLEIHKTRGGGLHSGTGGRNPQPVQQVPEVKMAETPFDLKWSKAPCYMVTWWLYLLQNWSCGRSTFTLWEYRLWTIWLLWPWSWPDDLHIRTWPVLPGAIPDVLTSHVKAFESYRLDRQTDIYIHTYIHTDRQADRQNRPKL